MAHGHHDPGLPWEWDSVLLLANPCQPVSPSFETDGNSALREPGASAIDSSFDHRHHQHEKSCANQTQADSVSSKTRDNTNNGDNRRDPRLDCPNFLAGKVPCACTDNDDDESGGSRKRSKPAPRCQVLACRTELTDLKGYHQRHRVCLRCAHATRVTLREQPHRYCQQCGKFHPICDFDEGKRSCRRKLERHNNRRRRKANEDGLPALDSGDTDTQYESSPVDGTNNSTENDVSSEGEPKGLIGELLLLDAEQILQTSGLTSNQSLLVKVPETAVLNDTGADISLPGVESSLAASLGENIPTSEPSSSCMEVSQRLDLQYSREQSCSLAEQVPFSVEPRQDSIHMMSPDDFSLDSSAHPDPEGGSRISSGNAEESLLALLLGENRAAEDSQLSENADEHLTRKSVQPWESLSLPENLSKQVSYCSPLPTGRISFKLYNWNPGDFPRQLRQQVMDWLSNMPVDLEGYIRSGCTILTIFIAMPQSRWDELSADWAGSVLKLVKAEKSVPRFWSSGSLTARMDDQVVHINNGDLSCPLSQRVGTGEPPVLHRVRPLCLEAGCEEEVVVFGHNIWQLHSRLLMSFEGNYSVNEAYNSPAQGAKQIPIARVDGKEDGGSTRLLIRMPSLHTKSCGTAYIEVEHLGGTSNYIPLLVAEKKIAEEVRSLEKEMDEPTTCCSSNIDGSLGFPHLSQRRAQSLLLDLGWVLRNIACTNRKLDCQSDGLELHVERLRRLLFFGVKRSWYSVVERVLQLANREGLMTKIGMLGNGLTALQFAVLHHNVSMVEHLITCAESLCVGTESMFWWNPEFPGPKGLTALHIVSLLPGAWGLFDTLCKEKGIASMWESVQNHETQTPKDYATHEGKLSCKVEIRDFLTRDGYTRKTNNALIDPNNFREFQGFSPLKRETRTFIPNLPYAVRVWKVTHRTIVGGRLPFGIFGQERLNLCISSSRKNNYRLLSSVSILLVCAGLCLILQRPNQVILLSLSLRRDLIGLGQGSQ